MWQDDLHGLKRLDDVLELDVVVARVGVELVPARGLEQLVALLRGNVGLQAADATGDGAIRRSVRFGRGGWVRSSQAAHSARLLCVRGLAANG